MFLSRVFQHSKLLGLFMVAFIAGQLFVAYNHGMVFSPFYNYWMYASRFTRSDSLPVIFIYSEGQPLKGSDYIQQDWDKILLTHSYVRHPDANRNLYGEIKRLTKKVGYEMGPGAFLMPSNLAHPDTMYMLWKQHTGRISGKKIDKVLEKIYRWDGQKLIPR